MTIRSIKDGVYYTGDVATRDKDGYYWFVSRADDVIKSSGYRIGPFEVESALMTPSGRSGMRHYGCTGRNPRTGGQGDPSFWPALTRPLPMKNLIKQIQDYVKHITAPYKYPRIIEFVDELPKTISGKIRRIEIRGKRPEQGSSQRKSLGKITLHSPAVFSLSLLRERLFPKKESR